VGGGWGGSCVDALSTRVSKMDMILQIFSMLTDCLSLNVHSCIVRSFSTVLATVSSTAVRVAI